MERTNGSLPPLYARWMAELLPGPVPPEAHASCHDCAMIDGYAGGEVEDAGAPRQREEAAPADAVKAGRDGEEAAHVRAYSFSPRTKCCTYLPDFPNFLVGRMLADGDPSVRASMLSRLREHGWGTPLGLDRPPSFPLPILPSVMGFGRPRAPACPHFREAAGNCAIWAHREAGCATWFCKHVRGATGMRFWRHLYQLLAAAEVELAAYCALDLGIGSRSFALMMPAPGSPLARVPPEETRFGGLPDEAMATAIWGDWKGREEEYYHSCARIVDALSWNEISLLGSPQLKVFARGVENVHGALTQHTLPELLLRGPYDTVALSPGVHRIWSYSPHDPLDVPAPLVDALAAFDGRATCVVLGSLADEQGIELDPALVVRLLDFRILVPGDQSVR